MEKKVVKYLKVLLFAIATIFTIFFITPREFFISLLSENSASFQEKVDVYFVFSGGFYKNRIPGRSTSERMALLKKLLKLHPDTPFVFLDYRGGKIIVKKIYCCNSYNKIIKSNYRYNSELSGTVNNIKELISILKSHPELKKIGIITSIYHEKRVYTILNRYLKKENLKKIKVLFFHDKKNQEIFSCSYARYAKLIFHEFIGIIYFKFTELP